MSNILILIAAEPEQNPLGSEYERILSLLSEVTETKIDWKVPDHILGIEHKEELSIDQIKVLRKHLKDKKIDIFLFPQQRRSIKLLVADMDSTIIVGETLDELAEFASVKQQVQDITSRAMNGEINFEAALRERVALLAGLSEEALDETASALQIMPGARSLIQSIHKRNGKAVLVTGGFMNFAEDIGHELGFDHVHANMIEARDGLLTGEVIPPIIDKNSKLAYLQHYMQHYNIKREEILAIGDGANDLPMIQAAGVGIGYHPKPVLQKVLPNIVEYGDLGTITMLLENFFYAAHDN